MKIADHENAPLVYLVVMTWKRQWFSWTCWSLAVLVLRLSTIFFSFSKISESQKDSLCEEKENSISVRLAWIIFSNLFYYSAYFCYYPWVTLHFLVLFIGPTILFQLIFTFIYSTFSKKFLVLAIKTDSKCVFGKNYFCQLILLFSLFLLLCMSLTVFFDTIHGSYGIISANFYFYLQYF